VYERHDRLTTESTDGSTEHSWDVEFKVAAAVPDDVNTEPRPESDDAAQCR